MKEPVVSAIQENEKKINVHNFLKQKISTEIPFTLFSSPTCHVNLQTDLLLYEAFQSVEK